MEPILILIARATATAISIVVAIVIANFGLEWILNRIGMESDFFRDILHIGISILVWALIYVWIIK